MRSRTAQVLLVAAVACAACRRVEPGGLDPVRGLGRPAGPAFRPPADGVLSEAQLEMYLKVRRAAGDRPGAAAAASAGADPEEYAWVRGRVVGALAALDTKRVAEAALVSYEKSIATLREARRGAWDARTISRIDAELLDLERESASLRRREPEGTAVLANAARVEKRRAEIESLGP